MRLRLLAFAGLLALGAGIAAAVLIARSPSARHPEPAAAHAAPRPKRHATPKPRVASFDDGYLSDFTVALPTLRKHGWAGVLNLIVDSVRNGDIGAGQVRRLIAAGWEIDAHTVTHADLLGLDPARLRFEVSGSRARLRETFGQPVDFFCYPVGHYDAAVVSAVRAAGFLGATTENPGIARPTAPFTLSRIRIDSGDRAAQLAAKLAAAR